jgi:hypothetical protein
MDVSGNRIDAYGRVHPAEAFRRGLRLRLLDIGFRVEGLTLQVHELDHVSIDETNVADACPYQEIGGNAAEGSQADDDDIRFGERPLTPGADLGEDDLTAIAIRPSHGGLREGGLMAFADED